MKTSLACIILASGHSTRFGSNKLLAPFHGQPLIYHTLTKIQALQLPCITVTRFPEIVTLCQELRLPVLLHNEPYQNDTIRLGLTALLKQNITAAFTNLPLTEANSNNNDIFFPGKQPSLEQAATLTQSHTYNDFMFCTGDQPLLQISSFQKLIAAFQAQPTYIHRLSYHGTPGNPVIFPSCYLQQLLTLPQDKGGSYIIKQHTENLRYVEATSALELTDIDTSEQLLKLEKASSES